MCSLSAPPLRSHGGTRRRGPRPRHSYAGGTAADSHAAEAGVPRIDGSPPGHVRAPTFMRKGLFGASAAPVDRPQTESMGDQMGAAAESGGRQVPADGRVAAPAGPSSSMRIRKGAARCLTARARQPQQLSRFVGSSSQKPHPNRCQRSSQGTPAHRRAEREHAGSARSLRGWSEIRLGWVSGGQNHRLDAARRQCLVAGGQRMKENTHMSLPPPSPLKTGLASRRVRIVAINRVRTCASTMCRSRPFMRQTRRTH